MPMRARIYVAVVVLCGLACLARADWRMEHQALFACYLAICIVTSGTKLNLPGVPGTMSVSFLFVLLGIQELGGAQTMLIGCAGALAPSLWRPKSGFRPVPAVFSVALLAVTVFSAHSFYHWPPAVPLSHRTPLALIAASLIYFFLNTAGMAAATGLTERKSLLDTWRKRYFWSFPFHLAGASVAWVFSLLSERGHFESSLLLVPVIYVIYRSYRVYLCHLEDEKKHAEEMAALHLRTIEALALAIDAKDHTTHEHLSRVRTYAVGLAKEMNLPEQEWEALRAAALLHDIGKLAVPEHIISKPGKLTPEEFGKMKIHPVVGAEILERVEFPYPVAPIVRSHHEKWDGTGYPDGLKGEEIPIGARILAAVDCLDALASDRQYRRALALDQAMAEVAKLSGTAFDPHVVAILGRKYVELERLAASQPVAMAQLSKDIEISRGGAPAAGFELSHASILHAIREDSDSSSAIDETLSVVAARLKRLVPYDAIAAYVIRDGCLLPEYVNGENCRLLSSLRIPLGEGVSGWVAQTGRPVVNGNPAVESAALADNGAPGALHSALAVPLVGLTGSIGVLTLFRTGKDAFSADHLRVLLAVAPQVSLALENALKFRHVETTATTDSLTGLPNARSLFPRLDSELARSKRTEEPLTVLVCHLDGFKTVNDCYGHLVGNKVLRAVGNALRGSCREYDYVARMRGGEFVLILPASDRGGMRRRIGEWRETGGAAGCAVTGTRTMTMSIGEAFYPQDGTDAEQLLAAAGRRANCARQGAKIPRPAVASADTPALAAVQ